MAQQTRTTEKKGVNKVEWNFPLERTNWMILGIGVASIVVGYVLMHVAGQAQWDSPLAISVAPFILVVGFIVIIPYGLMWRPKELRTSSDTTPQ
jgi:hypothetical protein